MSVRIVELNEATETLSDYLSELGSGPLIVTNQGEPIAVLTSLDNIDLETVAMSSNEQFIALIERSRARTKSEGGISSGEMRKRLGLE